MLSLPGVTGVCTPHSGDPDVPCYEGASPYRYSPPAGVQGNTKVPGGWELGSTRLMVAYARHLMPGVTASLRAGMAITGGGVVPWFGEVKYQYLFSTNWLGGKLLPYHFLSFGVMRIETREPVQFTEFDSQKSMVASDHGDVVAVRTMSWAFGSSGFGLRATLAERWYLDYDVGWLLSVPELGAAVRSALGVSYDF
jgi:hypothetical protein